VGTAAVGTEKAWTATRDLDGHRGRQAGQRGTARENAAEQRGAQRTGRAQIWANWNRRERGGVVLVSGEGASGA